MDKFINTPMAGGGGGGEGGGMVFQFFLGMGRAFIPNKTFSCSLILGAFVHENLFQIGPTVLVLKLDKRRMLDAGG